MSYYADVQRIRDGLGHAGRLAAEAQSNLIAERDEWKQRALAAETRVGELALGRDYLLQKAAGLAVHVNNRTRERDEAQEQLKQAREQIIDRTD